MSEYKFSSFWKMFTPDGLQVTFGVADDDMPAQLNSLNAYMSHLRNAGYLPQMPGLEDGEKIEEIDAYVVGESSKGDGCVYLYAANHGLQFRLATVYVEKFGDLPFKVAGKKWDASAAPQREEAEKKGYLVTVPAFKVVMEQKGVTDDGKPQWRFARVFAKPAATSAPADASNGNGKPAASGAGFDEMTSAQDARACTEEQRKAIFTLVNRLYGKEHAEEQFRPWLKGNFGTDSTKSLTVRQATQVIDLLKVGLAENGR